MLHGPWTSEEGCEILEVRYAATELLTGAQGQPGTRGTQPSNRR